MPDTVVANPGSSGAIFATDVVTSSVNYVLQKLAYGSTGVANLVSSAFPFPVASASSGLVQISGTPTVTATAATNPWSSAPGFNLPVVSVSSGLVQVSGNPTIIVGTTAGTAINTSSAIGLPTFYAVTPTSSVAGAAIGPVTSSAGVLVSLSSGTISLSSQITVTATGPVTITSGIVTLSSVHTVTATAGTNPWSSAPSFNVPVVSVSSGLVQISGTPTVLSASSGFIQMWPAVTPTSSVAGASLGPVTSSAGVLASLTSGTVSLSSQITVTATGPVTVTSGLISVTSGTITSTAATNPWSSAPGFNIPTVSVSSGLVQISAIAVSPTSSIAGAALAPVTSSAGVLASLSSGTVSLSSQISVTSTAATNPWSSAPGFNLPVVNVSSGLVQISGTPLVNVVGTSSAIATVTSSGGLSVTIVAGAVGSTAVNILGTQGVIVVTVTSGSFASGLYVFSTAGGGAGSTAVNLSVVSAAGFAPVTSSAGLVTNLSSGTVTLSSIHTIFSASSGGIQVFIPISPTSSVAGAGFGPVTSSAGVLTAISSGTVSLSSQITVTATGPVTITSGTVTATAGTNPWSSAPTFNLPVVSVSSGLIQLSSQITVTATGPVTITSGLISVTSGTITSTSATNPWSSAPGFNIPTVSVSSGLSQISAIQVSPTSSVAGAGLLVITSSFGLVTQSTQPITVTSGTVTLSSVHTVTATGPMTITSGTVTLSSVHTVTATAATNPWSSAPGFNVPVVTVSSGLIQLSSQITVTATGPVTVTSGLISVTSGTITSTAATNPWSSAPGFNIPVVNVSSGFVQIFEAPPVVTSNIVSTYFFSTGGAASVNVRGSASALLGYSYFNTTVAIRGIKIYNSSSAPGIGTTTNVLVVLVAPGSTGGGGANMALPLPGLFASNGIGFTMTANANATDTGAPGLNDLALTLYFV